MGIFETLLLGFIASLTVVIVFEYIIQPKLKVTAEKSPSLAPDSLNPQFAFYHVMVTNLPAMPLFPNRRPVWSCQAQIEVWNLEGKSMLATPILARWSSQPEPHTTVTIKNTVTKIVDMAKIIAGRKIDIHSHVPE